MIKAAPAACLFSSLSPSRTVTSVTYAVSVQWTCKLQEKQQTSTGLAIPARILKGWNHQWKSKTHGVMRWNWCSVVRRWWGLTWYHRHLSKGWGAASLEEQRPHAANFALLFHKYLKVLIDDGDGQQNAGSRADGSQEVGHDRQSTDAQSAKGSRSRNVPAITTHKTQQRLWCSFISVFSDVLQQYKLCASSIT